MRAVQLMQRADVVMYDRLVSDDILGIFVHYHAPTLACLAFPCCSKAFALLAQHEKTVQILSVGLRVQCPK
jgi:siroheme synthase